MALSTSLMTNSEPVAAGSDVWATEVWVDEIPAVRDGPVGIDCALRLLIVGAPRMEGDEQRPELVVGRLVEHRRLARVVDGTCICDSLHRLGPPTAILRHYS